MSPRWKGKGAEAKSMADPMSKIVLQLQFSLLQSNSHATLLGSTILLPAESEQINLLNRSSFGRPIATAENNKQWFQLGLEEAFYLSHSLNCLEINLKNNSPKNNEEIWQAMKSKKPTFPDLYKAYSHLRMKNWVVKSGSRYGVDFVAYRHHPSLVHSEYAVLVLSEEESGSDVINGRLKVWSDYLGTIRLCGSVAKTLLVLRINKHGNDDVSSPACLERFSVDECTVTRWSPKQCREDHLPEKHPGKRISEASKIEPEVPQAGDDMKELQDVPSKVEEAM